MAKHTFASVSELEPKPYGTYSSPVSDLVRVHFILATARSPQYGTIHQ